MTRIIFWNVKEKDLTPLVCSLAIAAAADVIVLNENGTDSKATLCTLRADVSPDFFIPSFISEKRFHCFCRESSLDMSEVHSGSRTSVRKLHLGTHQILLVLVHGLDLRNYDPPSRQSYAQEISSDLQLIKNKHETDKVILLGDFNMNPYEPGMTLAAGFNAMMTKECVKPGVRRYQNKTYDFYYNPMWSLFGDMTDGPAGTFYDLSPQGLYGWNMLDQVIIHHSIVKMFVDVKILTSAGTDLLMDGNGRPDKNNASDHFPIQLTLREDGDEYVLPQGT